LLGVASVRVLVSVFYAMEKPRIPVLAAVLALLVNVISDLALMGPTDAAAPWWGAAGFAAVGDALRIADLRHAGLAAGTSIAATVNGIVLVVLVKRRLPMLGVARLARSALLHVMAAVAMGASVVLWQRFVGDLGPLAELPGAMALAVTVYVGVAWILGSAELAAAFGLLRRFRNRSRGV
jgi:peptidoglycan biosynthesis protein MviN/MurJ (putative lipid II flippase)